MRFARKPLSPARRRARFVVWALLAAALLVRWLFPPDPEFRRGLFQSAWEWRGGPEAGFGPGQDRWRRQRPRTRIPVAVAQIPADLWRIRIELEPAAVSALGGYFWNGWQGGRQERPEVRATVREGGQVFTNVAIHLKGAAGSFRPLDDKPAFTLNFAKHAPGQRFHGHTKISLNNSVQDPSYLCEAIARGVFEAAGVPVPRVDFATVVLNGVDKGLYVLAEGFNKDFLRRHFSDVRGNLYDGGFCQEVHAGLRLNSGDNPDDRSAIERLISAATEADPARRWERLGTILDRDRFVSMLAVEALTCHWDGYGMNRNNYRLFHDRAADRLVFMPHGLDQMFDWPPGRFPPEGPIQPEMQGAVARAVLSTPEGSRLYMERLGQIHTNLFQEQALTNRVWDLARRLRPTLAAYGPDAVEEHDQMVASLSDRISRRIRSVSQQLNTTREPMVFGADGTAPLSNWAPRMATPGRGVTLNETEALGRPALRVAFRGRGWGTASWRTRVFLEPGRYRFEGLGRIVDGDGSRGGGMCLRISGHQVGPQIAAAGDWSLMRYVFAVEEPSAGVELICEFQGAGAEGWFDRQSLRLVRE
jgi:hypothetical protein